MTTEFLVAPPFNTLDIDIPQDADWNDPFQVVEQDGTPYDLTDAILELYVRPRFAHDTLFFKLTSGTEIIVEDAAAGLVYFNLDRALVLAEFPIGEWQQFMVLTEGTTQTELWRGQFRVHPGIITA